MIADHAFESFAPEGLYLCRMRNSSVFTFRAGTNLPQPLPGVNPKLVAVIPVELNCVLANSSGRKWLSNGFVHSQFIGCGLSGLTRLPMCLCTFFIAKGTWTGVSQIWEGVAGNMAIFPLDSDALAGCQVNFDRLRISGHANLVSQKRGWAGLVRAGRPHENPVKSCFTDQLLNPTRSRHGTSL